MPRSLTSEVTARRVNVIDRREGPGGVEEAAGPCATLTESVIPGPLASQRCILMGHHHESPPLFLAPASDRPWFSQPPLCIKRSEKRETAAFFCVG